jgi:predicted murein hydrolase (TIGR00659 family)
MTATRPVFLQAMTLLAYALGLAVQRLGGGSPLLNPTLIAISVLAGLLALLHVDYGTYFSASQAIHVLLGPAIVALAVPLFRHLALCRGRFLQLGLALLAGSIAATASSLILGKWLGLSQVTLISLAPRSATTAVSMEVSARIGGIPAVTAVLTILTGITAAVIGRYVLCAIRVDEPTARGFGMGLAGHGIATARAFQDGETTGAFAGLAMALNAVATSILTPIMVRLLL